MTQNATTFVVTPKNKPEKVKFQKWSDGDAHHLTSLHEYEAMNGKEVLQATAVNNEAFVPSPNGFVHAVIHAYNQHHNLSIRPDDIWLAIVLQFSRFLNANAENLRSKFVAHSGQKELEIRAGGSLRTVDFGELAKLMADLMRENVKDPQVCSWILPSFSTTTDNDRIVSSVALMTAMQKYFAFKMSLMCGIPQITVLGTVEDWKDIQQRVKKLAEYGPECTKWSGMLSNIVDEIVKTVAGPPADINLKFWQRICHYTATGSGPSYISGWLSAFAVFTEKGVWQGDKLSLKTWMGQTIDGLDYPVIDEDEIPGGYATVDVIVDDNGTEHKCAMFVGHTGYNVIQEGTGIAPQLTWGIVIKGN